MLPMGSILFGNISHVVTEEQSAGKNLSHRLHGHGGLQRYALGALGCVRRYQK